MKKLLLHRKNLGMPAVIGGLVACLALAAAVGRHLWVSRSESRALELAVGADDEPVETTASEAPEPKADASVLETEPAPEAGALAFAPDPEQQAWEQMTAELSRRAGRHPGRAAIFLRDLKSGRTWTYHADDLFPSASLIKVPIMASVFYRMQEGRMSLGDRLVLRRHHRVGGSGSIKWSLDGTKFTVRELLYKAIGESDNTATAMLIDALGLDYIRHRFAKMGLFYTEIYPEGMSIKGGRVAHENYTTAREMAGLLEKIYKGELVDRQSSDLMMDILTHRRRSRSRLAKGLPHGWRIAHKTGLVRRACHDSAIILTPSGDYSLTVLTGQNGGYGSAKDFITALGKITYRHYRDAPGEMIARASGRRAAVVR